MRYLLDTNTCIYIIKRSPEHVHQRFKGLRVGDVGISAITFCELQFGVSKSVKAECCTPVGRCLSEQMEGRALRDREQEEEKVLRLFRL